VAVVYFSGRGMEIAGENWPIPVGAERAVDLAAEQEAVSLKRIMPPQQWPDNVKSNRPQLKGKIG
jgi:uncharacterized caspase-like protein